MAGLRPVLARLARGETLSETEAEAAFGLVMSGEVDAPQIAALVMALRLRGETVAELTGAVRAMRGRMLRISAPPEAIDVCGTGGDGADTLNVSTAVAFVLAGLGVPVAKHGNRASSSRAGGADVLAALGVTLDLPPDRLETVLRRAGCVFLFAPNHHPALRHAAAARTALGLRTIFNLLGPLANPAGVRRQLVGVFDPAWAQPMAEVLARTGSEAAWIVHGSGLDELSLAGENRVTELRDGVIRSFVVRPAELGLATAPIDSLRGGDAAHNAHALSALLDGEMGPYRDTVMLNAAAALIVAGRADTLRAGLAMAARSLDGGAAHAALDRLRQETAPAAA